MSDVFGLGDVVLGDEKLPDWREDVEEEDSDDELLDKTPEDVVAILGFDPLELNSDA